MGKRTLKTHICKVVANHTSLRCNSNHSIDWTFTNHLPLKSAIIELQFQKKFDPSVANYVLQIHTFVEPLNFGLTQQIALLLLSKTSSTFSHIVTKLFMLQGHNTQILKAL